MQEAGGSLVNIGEILTGFATQAIGYLPKIVLAVVVLWIGFKIIAMIMKFVNKALDARGIDPSIKGFLSSIISILFKIALFIAVASTLGIDTTSFVAILGGASLAVGLALQGNLANFAGGVMILLFKPFQVGEYIKAQGMEGFVRDISIFVTKLETHDGETHFIPNGKLSSENITNVSKHGKIRVHIPGAITHQADIDTARAAVLRSVAGVSGVLSDPAPDFVITELAADGIKFESRVWCDPMDVPGVTVNCNEAVKKSLDAAGITVPILADVFKKMAS